MVTTVTGFTSDRMLAIENSTIVDGNVVGNNLILVTRDGTLIDAGNVRGPQGDVGPMGEVTQEELDAAIAAATAAGAITSIMLAASSVSTAKIADGAIVAAKLAVASVTSPAIAVDSIMQSHLQDSVVGTAEIIDAAVTAVKLAPGAVTAAKIADGVITAAKLAAGIVDTTKLANLAVTGAKIADATITEAKLSTSILSSAWQDCGLGAGWNIPSTRRLRVKKIGNVGYLSGDLKRVGAGGTVVAAQLPASFIATESMSGVCAVFSGAGASTPEAPANFQIVPISGEIVVYNAITNYTYCWLASYELA